MSHDQDDPSRKIATSSSPSPRVLVVAEFGPGAPGGSWVILKQLLRGLDWNHIYWWSFFGASTSSYEFGGRHHSCNVPPKLAPNKRWLKTRAQLLETVFVPYAANHLLSTINSVKPDFILYLAHCWGIPVVHRIMPKINAHFHLALHDMPETVAWKKSLGLKRTARFMRYIEEMYRTATSHAVIGPEMAHEMKVRTGVDCTNIFRCAVEPEILSKLSEPKAKPDDDVIRIGYAGTIIAEATFARLVKALQIVRQRLNRKIEIHLFSWHSYRNRDWFDPSLIVELGAKSEAEIYACYQKLTWGLAIMKLDDDDPFYNRYSFPCKFTPSLAAGLPLICMGHRSSTLVQLAKNYRLGLLFTDEDENSLEDKLSESIGDFSHFEENRSEILRCARLEFNAADNRAKLHKLILGSKGNLISDPATDSTIVSN